MKTRPVPTPARSDTDRTPAFEPYYQAEPAAAAKAARPAPALTPLDLMYAYFDAA